MALTEKQKALGWVEMTVAEFLGETPAESAHIEIGLDLSEALKSKRLALGLTQKEAAKQMGTTQPNIARMEMGVERSVTIDLLMKYLLQLGCTRAEIGAIVTGTNDTLVEHKIEKPLVVAKQLVSRRKAAPKSMKPKRTKVEAL